MSSETHAGNVGAGRDFVGRDATHDQSGSAHVSVSADSGEWMTAQITIITNQLAQVNQRLKKLDQIDEALVGNPYVGGGGLVDDVRRLWAVVIGMLIFLALLGVVEAAQWWLLWHMMQL